MDNAEVVIKLRWRVVAWMAYNPANLMASSIGGARNVMFPNNDVKVGTSSAVCSSQDMAGANQGTAAEWRISSSTNKSDLPR